MKLTLDRAVLLKALEPAQRVVERRNTIPILGNLLFDAKGGALVISATDLDILLRCTVPAEIAEPGALTLPAARLYDIVRKLPDGVSVSFDGNEQSCTVRSGRSRFQMQTLPESDFPDISAGELPHSFTLTPATIATLIDSTRFAICTEETRYYLGGIFLHHRDGKLFAVATDGHRLARYRLDAPAGSEAMPGIILPRKTVEQIKTLAAGAKAEIEVALSSTKIRFTIGDTVLTSKLIDGTYPDYQRVIPQANGRVATLDRPLLAAASDRVATISSERGRAVKLSFASTGLALSVTNPDAGEARDEVDCEWEGDGFEIGFNAKYLAESLAVVGGDTVQIQLSEPGAPAIIQSGDDADLLTVLMPMRI